MKKKELKKREVKEEGTNVSIYTFSWKKIGKNKQKRAMRTKNSHAKRKERKKRSARLLPLSW